MTVGLATISILPVVQQSSVQKDVFLKCNISLKCGIGGFVALLLAPSVRCFHLSDFREEDFVDSNIDGLL